VRTVKANYSTWIGIGAGIGASVGVATHHLAIWIAVGAAWGIAMVFLARRGWLK
jgi:hypothetical protein